MAVAAPTSSRLGAVAKQRACVRRGCQCRAVCIVGAARAKRCLVGVRQRRINQIERGRRKTCTLLPRSALAAGDPPRPGPLLVEDGTSTIYVPDGWTAAIGEAHCLVMRRAQDQQEDTIG